MELKRKNDTDSLYLEKCHAADGSEVPLLKYPLLEKTGMVEHCFSTRMGGVSEGIFSSMNLSFTRGDDREAVEMNFHRIAEAMGVPFEKMVFTDQTHTTCVRKVTARMRERGYCANAITGMWTESLRTKRDLCSVLFLRTVCLYIS